MTRLDASIIIGPLKNVGVRIDYADDRAVGRRFVAFEWERRLFSAAPKNELAFAGTDRVESDRRFPFGFRSASSVCTIRNLRPWSVSFLTVATTVPMTRAICIYEVGNREIDLVDDADDRRVDRAILIALGQAGGRAADDDHLFVKAGADRVDRDNIAALVSAVEVDRLDDEQLFP